MIDLASDFTSSPAGRYYSDGPFPGEMFRQELLLPALNKGAKVIVDFSGVTGAGSSFLEEAFGGLVRAGHSPAALKNNLIIKNCQKTREKRIWQYISDAGK